MSRSFRWRDPDSQQVQHFGCPSRRPSPWCWSSREVCHWH